jgi:hypothetical protein
MIEAERLWKAGKQKPPRVGPSGVLAKRHASRSSRREGGVRDSSGGRSPDSRVILLANAFRAASRLVAHPVSGRPRSQWRVREGIAPSSQQLHLQSSNCKCDHPGTTRSPRCQEDSSGPRTAVGTPGTSRGKVRWIAASRALREVAIKAPAPLRCRRYYGLRGRYWPRADW